MPKCSRIIPVNRASLLVTTALRLPLKVVERLLNPGVEARSDQHLIRVVLVHQRDAFGVQALIGRA